MDDLIKVITENASKIKEIIAVPDSDGIINEGYVTLNLTPFEIYTLMADSEYKDKVNIKV